MKKLLLIAATALWFAGCSDRNEGIGGPKDGVAIAFSLDCGALSASVGAAQTGQPAQVAPIAQTAAQTALATRAAVPIANGTTVRIVALHAGDALGSTPAASATYYVTGEETADGHKRAVLAPCTVTNDATGAVTAYSDDPTKVMRLKAGEYDFYAFSPALPLKSDGKSVDVYHGMDFAASATAGVVVKSDGSTTYPDPMNAAPATKNGAIGSGAVELQTLERKCSFIRFAVTRTDEAAALVSSVSVDHLLLDKIAVSPVTSTSIASDITPVADLRGSHTFASTLFTYPDQTNKPYELIGGDAVLPKASGALEFSARLRFNDAVDSSGQPKWSDLGPVTLGAISFEKGIRYTYTLKLKGDAIIVILTVGPWNLADDLDLDFSGDELIPGIVVGEWTNVDWS
ncbi:MAG: BF2992 family fimbrillin-A clan protein, partial [Alistipes sp.]|nr:BF2992 family fimbrillin-A clan protein [Alistipes sp.]